MSAAKHTPGPWTVQMMSKPQVRRFHVARQVEDGTWSSPHWEQLHAEDGSTARFETSEEARAAADKANDADIDQELWASASFHAAHGSAA